MNHCVDIRLLNADDVALLRDMLSMFGKAFDDIDAYTARQPNDAYLEQLLSSRTFIAIGALSGPKVVGGLAAYVLPKFEQARSEVYIYDLAVDENFRREGVATGMIAALQNLAGALGAYVIFVQADLADKAAIALYTKLGVREDVLHFDIAPTPAAAPGWPNP